MKRKSRKYKKPLSSVEQCRLLRVICSTRIAIKHASLEEEAMPLGQFVGKHQRVYNKMKLFNEFPFLDVREGAYASDLLGRLAQDMLFYVKTGDTPGGPP